jgi:hypothetical protein
MAVADQHWNVSGIEEAEEEAETVESLTLDYSLDPPADPELVKPQLLQLAPPPEPALGPPLDELYMSKSHREINQLRVR